MAGLAIIHNHGMIHFVAHTTCACEQWQGQPQLVVMWHHIAQYVLTKHVFVQGVTPDCAFLTLEKDMYLIKCMNAWIDGWVGGWVDEWKNE